MFLVDCKTEGSVIGTWYCTYTHHTPIYKRLYKVRTIPRPSMRMEPIRKLVELLLQRHVWLCTYAKLKLIDPILDRRIWLRFGQTTAWAAEASTEPWQKNKEDFFDQLFSHRHGVYKQGFNVTQHSYRQRCRLCSTECILYLSAYRHCLLSPKQWYVESFSFLSASWYFFAMA